jgi:hypothetical protein
MNGEFVQFSKWLPQRYGKTVIDGDLSIVRAVLDSLRVRYVVRIRVGSFNSHQIAQRAIFADAEQLAHHGITLNLLDAERPRGRKEKAHKFSLTNQNQ